MHQPSLPEDLDRPELLWARAVTLAVLDAACSVRTDFAVDDDGVWCHSTGAGGWWRLTVLDGTRAVFCGQDPDGSHTHVGGRQIDFLAGGPAWLPWGLLREDAAGNLFGFVYWWEDGAWHRIPYPDEMQEDGLDGAAPWAGSHEEFLELAVESRDVPYERRRILTEAVERFVETARERKADEAAVAALLAPARAVEEPAPRLEVALTLAARAGVLA
ncbi:hypothetical protein [Streptomyces sp. NBC_00162]|uniref:hypothetical protein n=1 Tax=Streptomyces sp. NBC_00162 TaxID=2903629 RepID=UPI00214AE666|nr:hypothetical protein [Streptomyces sp. NBC_00162]UUU38569.1 hypothetical protein JIW86_06905 [Streptomyces sp. NBC_00162]